MNNHMYVAGSDSMVKWGFESEMEGESCGSLLHVLVE